MGRRITWIRRSLCFEITGLDNINLNSFANDLYFIEPYIDGREFNVSLLAINSEPVVLAVAEILFVDYPSDKPKVLGYRAKWNEESFEFKNTVRTYDLGKNGNQIHKLLSDISLKCWKTLGLKGYARVDFRMDNSGNPFILEVNANPCITLGAVSMLHANMLDTALLKSLIKLLKRC